MEKKKLIIICASTIGVITLVILGIWIASKFKKTFITYENLENKMKVAAKKYYEDNIETMPSEDGTYSLDYSILSNNNYLKPITEYLKNGNECSASITVIKNETDYSYIPYLNCGTEYETKELYKKIIEDNDIVSNGNGLYQGKENEYYFRGKIDNNYVSLGNKKNGKKEVVMLWRILSINEDTIRLRSVTKYNEKTVWDERYNENERKNVGYNQFETSEISTFLKNIKGEDLLFESKYKSMISPKNLCVGTRDMEDHNKDGNTECSVLSEDTYYFSTLYPYEYMRASLDENCNAASSKSCSNLNFLSNEQVTEWSTIIDPKSNYKVYSFDGTTYSLTKASQAKTFYPIIELNKYSFYASGMGTENDPYIIKSSN